MTKPKRRLSAMVSTRFSPEELAALQEAAQKYGLTISAFIRGVALADDAVPVVDFDDIPQYAKDVLYGYREGYHAAESMTLSAAKGAVESRCLERGHTGTKRVCPTCRDAVRAVEELRDDS